MTGCIVGWAHTPFGRLDTESVESLIVRVATDAIADAGIAPSDVGEEGLGDLRGMKELFYTSMKGQIDKFVSVDGTGLGITNVGVGSNRYRVTFKGPGGHSFGAFGLVNPIQAMGRAIAKIDAFEVPTDPKTTFNVGRVGGGTSVNAIPFEAWMEVDMRSADAAASACVDLRLGWLMAYSSC